MKYKNKPFKAINESALGLAGLGLTTAVGAGIASKAPAGTPSMTEGFNTLAGFAPIATTAVVGKSLIGSLPKYKKKKGYY